MSEVRIVAEPRTEFGKGGARRTRRAGKVPAVLYGHGTSPRHVSLPGHELMLALKGGANTLLRLEVDGGTELALPRAVTRDPIKGFLEHLDLLLVRRGERVTVDVPVHLSGEATPGGLVDQQLTTLSVEADATAIPAALEVSIEALGVGAAVHAKDVPLPGEVVLAGDPEQVVVHVMASPTAEQLEGAVEGVAAELGAAGPGAAAQVAEGAAGGPEPAGRGDVVPDSHSGSGGPGEGSAPRS